MAHKGTQQYTKGHVLFVSRQRITGATNGSSAYLLDIAKAVRNNGFTPHLLQPSPTLLGRWPIMHLGTDLDVFETHQIRGVWRVGPLVFTRQIHVIWGGLKGVMIRLGRKMNCNLAWLKDRPFPYSIATPWTPQDYTYLQRNSKGKADILIADYAFQAEAIKVMNSSPSAIVMHDLFHTRNPQKGEIDSVALLDQQTEVALLSRADAVIAIQANEAQFVRNALPNAHIILCPIAVQPAINALAGNAHNLLFVGSNTAPNAMALQWFFEAIWPKIQAFTPDFTLNVVGSVASAFANGSPKGVQFHGIVEDLSQFYTQAGTVISPLTFGSGLKIKLVEAMAHGKAIVATNITLQGIENLPVDTVMLADHAADFTTAILTLAANDELRGQFARNALTYARTHFSPQACHSELIEWLNLNKPNNSTANNSPCEPKR